MHAITLNGMDAKQVLAQNLRQLMEADPNMSSTVKVAARSGVSQRTVSNMTRAAHDFQTSQIEKIAAAFRISVAQLLSPAQDMLAFDVVRVLRSTDETGKAILNVALEAAKARGTHGSRSGEVRELPPKHTGKANRR